ncbi:hypothetical protein DM02DRAFT_56531 [Periconia macrospinosa]|uniref:Uncharacterized protein n=1 Tax=Periconia macrospinosa TaxID=97972 RepID=A0A2V1E786_9PLEO|nr:hypothetical protein DM02DRAFT_56531 [Periconia macrospinosa]
MTLAMGFLDCIISFYACSVYTGALGGRSIDKQKTREIYSSLERVTNVFENFVHTNDLLRSIGISHIGL